MNPDQNLKIYNSLTGEKSTFVPINPGKIGLYVCGPTVYSHVHLGNVRTFMSFDFIYRYLSYKGYQVRYVRNITDAGHLTDDGDVNNDRFVKQSRLEKLEPMEIVQKYTVYFHDILKQFNLLPPTIEPTATGHIVEQITLTQQLIAKGLAYESQGSVYFDVQAYNAAGHHYGELSNRNIDELLANSRDLDGQDEKKNPQDFALWKKASPAHIMQWPSPWGQGFPGWHLECTAMSTKYLGDHFDIHGGGMDLKFPHHECEIAQGVACNGKAPVNYWLHANMLTLNGQRMSKSTGNTILPDELLSGQNSFFSKAFHPSVIRFFFLQAHYRSVVDISNDAVLASEKGFQKLMDALKILQNIAPGAASSFSVSDWESKALQALDDDFNSPILIAHLFDAVKLINQLKINNESLTETDLQAFKTLLNALVLDVLGLQDAEENAQDNNLLNDTIQLLIALRNQARASKNFAMSDQIRDQLLAIGVELKDDRSGTSFSLK